MHSRPRWIDAATAAAAVCRTRLPWERGLRRAAFAARRPQAAAPLPRPLRRAG